MATMRAPVSWFRLECGSRKNLTHLGTLNSAKSHVLQLHAVMAGRVILGVCAEAKTAAGRIVKDLPDELYVAESLLVLTGQEGMLCCVIICSTLAYIFEHRALLEQGTMHRA